ncbi:MAG: hypothetical protein KDC98_13290 [Planctomycetes bacterium]|nr:hypothetical protein [Planctomycetota bacterium]
MNHPQDIAVVHDSDLRRRGIVGRLLAIAPVACFAALLGGLGIYDLACPREAAVRRQAIAKGLELAPAVDPSWLDSSPPPVRKREIPARMISSWKDLARRLVLCEINETALLALWQKGEGLTGIFGPDAPREFDVFTMPGGAPAPRFRYPPLVTLPDGLTTNRFGFRGPDFALNKPEATVRIAVVGSSTTIDGHDFDWSFPELIGHWLDLWSKQNDLGVRFEVINAGREAIPSPDINAIVQYEVLPLAVDYVVYYEGQNQFARADLMRHVEVAGDASRTPPADLVTDLGMADDRAANVLDRTARFSDTARRLRRILGIYDDLPEPDKPAQSIVLPEGLDEMTPNLARAGELLQLGSILHNVEAMRRACEAARCRFVMCSFQHLACAGLRCGLREGHSLYSALNVTYWPLTYESVQRLSDLQNRYFEAWAAAHEVPFLDVANWLPDDPLLFSDMVHASVLGSRLRGWVMFCGLVPILARDLASGVVPVADTVLDAEHPYLKPARHVTAAELDGR